LSQANVEVVVDIDQLVLFLIQQTGVHLCVYQSKGTPISFTTA
jgi:hypothetical protein